MLSFEAESYLYDGSRVMLECVWVGRGEERREHFCIHVKFFTAKILKSDLLNSLKIRLVIKYP